MKPKQLVILTMVGGIDLIGETTWDTTDTPLGFFIKFEYPCFLQIAPPKTILFRNFLRDSPCLSGTSIMLNTRLIQWTNAPSREAESAYQAQRAGLLVANPGDIRLNG